MAIESDSGRGSTCKVLKDVVAFVEVWSSSRTENYSKTFAQQLLDMGATVSKTFNKRVTHVVFKDGHQTTWKKAKKNGVKLVSVLWVESCREAEAHIDESLYPAVNENEGLPDKIVKHRCMQPKDFIEKTPESNPRLRRRLDKLFENLKMQKSGTGSEVAMLSFSEDGLVQYSPSVVLTGQCAAMERRIREMKDKRENLSPTASQMCNSNSETDCVQSIGKSSAVAQSAEELPKDKLYTSFSELLERHEGRENGMEVSVGQQQRAAALSSKSYNANGKLPALNNYEFTNTTPQTFNKLLGKKKFNFFDNTDFTFKSVGNKIVKRKSFSKSSLENVDCRKITNLSCTTLGGGPSSQHSGEVSEEKTNLFHKRLAEDEEPKSINKIYSSTMNNTVQLDSPVTKVKNLIAVSSQLLEPMESTKKQKCRKGRRSSTPMVKLTVEELTNSVARGDGLVQPVRTPGIPLDWSPGTEEVVSAYEDFFSPANLKENKMRLPSLGALVLNSTSPSNGFAVRNPSCNKRLKLMHGSGKTQSKQKRMSVNTSCCNASVHCGTKPSIANKLPEVTNCVSVDDDESLNDFVDFRKDVRIACAEQNQKRSRKSVGGASSTKSPACIKDNFFSLPFHINESCISSPERSVILDSHSGNHEHAEVPFTTSEVANVIKECFGFSEASDEQAGLHVLEKTELEKSPDGLLKCEGMQECHLTAESVHYQSSTYAGLNNTSCEQTEAYNQKSSRTKAKHMPKRTLVMTSMPSEKQQTTIQVVNKLGGFAFSDSVCETTTHVLTGSPRRTLNILFGIARGCWILSYDWVLWSLEHGYWIPEEPYEVSDHFPAASICRLQRHLSKGQYQQDLFVNQPLMYVSSATQPPFKKLIELIKLFGGKVCKSLRPARICIGEYCGKKLPEIKYLSEQWILDSIMQHSVCPFENYILDS